MMAPFYLVPNPRNTHLAILIQRSFAPLEAAPIGGQPFAQDISRRDCTAFLLLFDTYDTRLLAQALRLDCAARYSPRAVCAPAGLFLRHTRGDFRLALLCMRWRWATGQV